MMSGRHAAAAAAAAAARRARWGSSPRMEIAVENKATEMVEKTPANKLLYAPPKFTNTPYE